MSIIAGIDVGNATTEVVIADASVNPPRPLAWDRSPTRGMKGTEQALRGALSVLERIERAAGVACDVVVVAPQRPVLTRELAVAKADIDLGRISWVVAGRPTPGGLGVAVGRPVATTDSPTSSDAPVVLVARDPLGFRDTVAAVGAWRAAGARVVAVLLSGDEAVLVSSRLDDAVPVVDGIDVDRALQAELIAVEVAPPGRTVQRLSDPVALAHLLQLRPDEHDHAELAAAAVRGSRDATVARGGASTQRPRERGDDCAITFSDGRRMSLLDALHEIACGGRAATLDHRGSLSVDDIWGVDLAHVMEESLLRAPSDSARTVLLAALVDGGGDIADPAAAIAQWSGRACRLVYSEAAAARAGALTTPSAHPDAMVVDIGAGTIDLVDGDNNARLLAGAGHLLTESVATVLGIGRGQAEWVKRGPCSRIESPQIALDEDGIRRYLDSPAGAGLVGWLTVPGPAGLLPFETPLAPSEWRGLRLRLKSAVIGANLARAGGGVPHEVILVGGPAGDDELLGVVARALPGTVPARGDVAGILGHRYSVAYGLVVLSSA
ncbi:MAG: hypothetical protein NTZ03_03390 [Actinobacteria bacterium]|nr:hypothetical protein [Actinomycetota bacterium]